MSQTLHEALLEYGHTVSNSDHMSGEGQEAFFKLEATVRQIVRDAKIEVHKVAIKYHFEYKRGTAKAPIPPTAWHSPEIVKPRE